MKKIITSLSIILASTISLSSVSAADLITPPGLQSVMQQNERYDRLQTLKERRQARTQSGEMMTHSGKIIISYRTIKSSPSVHISRANEVDLWVQELDLSQGARISSSLTNGGYDEATGEPLFTRQKLSEVLSQQSQNPISIINGQFFDPRKDPTPLSFGVKSDGIVRTAGADNRDSEKSILIIENSGASIVPYSWENLRDAPGYLALVSFSLGASGNNSSAVGQTYICLENPTVNNSSKKIVIFTATTMTERALEDELSRFGCTRKSTIKLDSSGSSRLWLDGEYIFGVNRNGSPDYRKIPNYLLVWEKAL